jgi:hypothetical protein
VHIGSGVCDIPQRRRLEGSFVCFDLCFVITSDVGEGTIIADTYSGIVKFTVGKECELGAESMTGGAVSFLGINEEGKAPDLSRGERALVAAVLIAIERGISA